MEDKKTRDEMNDDAILDRILGDDLDTQEMIEPTDIPKVEEEPEQEDAKVTEDSSSASEHTDVFKRDNVPQEFIDTLREKHGDEAVDAWAQKASARQANVDTFSKEMRELKDKVSDMEKGGKPSSDAQDDGNTATANTESTQQDDLGPLAEMYGEEIADPIRATRDQLNKLTGEIDRLKQEAEIRESIAYAIGDEAQRRGGMTTEQRKQVIDRANQMGNESPGSFNSVADMIQAASKELLGEPVKSKPTTQVKAQMTPPSQTPVPEKPLTAEEVEDQILDRILSS
jgi:hypothetical protein